MMVLASVKIYSGTASPGAKYFFEDLLQPLVIKLFLHLEAILHLQ